METILVAQDHLKAGGAAKAANRWVDLLRHQGLTIQQITGDEKPLKGALLSGKPPRGWERILECFRDPSSGRRSEVNRQLTSILSKEKSDLVWFHNIAGGVKWGWSEEMISIARQCSPVIWTLTTCIYCVYTYELSSVPFHLFIFNQWELKTLKRHWRVTIVEVTKKIW